MKLDPTIIRDRKALNRPGTATQVKGQERLFSILDAARNVLIEQGYANFTMRKVSAEAGISIGNLNYYYRTKKDLLKDLTEYVVNGYLLEFERLREQAGASPEKQLEAVLTFWIQDLNTPETTVFFPELWALANHHSYIAELADELYKKARVPLNELIPQINPTLTTQECERIALYMCATMEGLTVFAGYQKPWSAQIKELKKITIDNFLDLIKRSKGSKRKPAKK